MTTMEFGLIGYPLGHSRSRELFAEWGYEYRNYPIKDLNAEALHTLLATNVLISGLNITIPHKKIAAALADELDPLAQEVGAVNTLKILRDDDGNVLKIKGYNTDVFGFAEAAKPHIQSGISKAVVLGSGGASAAVCAACRMMRLETIVVSRNPGHGQIRYEDITADLLSHALIVNATPLGMAPNVDSFPPIPYEFVSKSNVCFDLVYNPTVTAFMRLCEHKGATVLNGYEMLRQQAIAALRIWTDS